MATSQELKTDSDFYQQEPNVHEVGVENLDERFHEIGEQVRAEHHYEEVRAHAREFGGDPELVTALSGTQAASVVKDAVADIQRQRALAEEMGPFSQNEDDQAPHNSSHN